MTLNSERRSSRARIKSLRDRLIAARERLGLSRIEMAERLLTPAATYKQWESGARRTPGIAVCAAELLSPRRRAAKGRAISPRRNTKLYATIRQRANGRRTIREIAEIIGVQPIAVRNAIAVMRADGEKIKIKSGLKRYSSEMIKPAIAMVRNGSSVACAVRKLTGGKDNPALHAYVSAACDAIGINRRRHPAYYFG